MLVLDACFGLGGRVYDMWRHHYLTALLPLFAPWLGACTADSFVVTSTDAAIDAANDGDAASTADAEGGRDGGPGCACTSPDVCCVYTTTQGATYSCAATCPQANQGQQLSQLACTSTADCAGSGEVCCISRTSGVNQSVCQPQCGPNQAQLCDPASPSSGCPAAAPCSNAGMADWNLPQSFGTCGGQGVP